MSPALAASRVGFGGYRISAAVPEHELALVRALAVGCDLIDTAPNYTGGSSEAVIGRVLARTGAAARVITKAGYAQGADLELIDTLERAGALAGEVVSPAPDFRYSIHPAFLAAQIARSRHRLGRDRIDLFLLHNPEHLFDTRELARDELYRRLGRAFAFLEQEVAQGRIGGYGISSGKLAAAEDDGAAIDLERVLAEARATAGHHHLHAIQFPCNLLERDALLARPGGSLVARARAAGVITIANRPLNAIVAGTPQRLASDDDGDAADHARDQIIIDEALAVIARALRDAGIDDDPMSYAPVRVIAERWARMPSLEAADQILHGMVRAFLDRLYDGAPGGDDARVFARMEQTILACARRESSAQAAALRARMISDGRLTDDERPLAVAACQDLLDAGIDHVLVGMRAVRYVDQLRPLFERPRVAQPGQ